MAEDIKRLALSLPEVAERLGLHRNTVLDMVNEGRIRARLAGSSKWIVPISALSEFLDGRDNPQRVYSASEVAAALGLHVNTVAKLLQSGAIRARKAGRDWKIPHEALEEYLEGRDNPEASNAK
jgi:excisionase family DNA binding protein